MYSIVRLNWKAVKFSRSTVNEFVEELTRFNPLVFRNRTWSRLGLTKIPRFDFGAPLGKRYCAPMFLEELSSLPKIFPSLEQTGFFISGFNWMTDYVIMPIDFPALKLFGRMVEKPIGRLLRWGLLSFCRPPFTAVLQLQAKGMKNGKERYMTMRLEHADAYFLTAAAVVACLLQYLDGCISTPVLYCQAGVVDPARFLTDVERFGVAVSMKSGDSSIHD